jgi:MFS family permease
MGLLQGPIGKASTTGQIGTGHQYKHMNVHLAVRASRSVPAEYRSNFHHLYLDIAWYGVLAASAMSFVTVYAARQGGSAFQIGLMSAGPAAINLVFTLPASQWLEKQSLKKAVFWSSVLLRFVYLLWVPLPMLLAPQPQIWTLILLTLIMNIPGTALAVGFNALFAEAVPPEWRGYVVGIRNALLSVTFIAVSLLSGQILDLLPFPMGYQVVFAIGFVGAVMSSWHLGHLALRPEHQPQPQAATALGDLARPGGLRLIIDSLRPGIALRFLLRRRSSLLSVNVLKGAYGRLILVVFAFYLAVQLAVPLFPLHWVDNLHLADWDIGLGTAVFYVGVFASSTQLARLVSRLGNQRVTAIGALFMSTYPALMGLAHGLGLFLVASALGGLGWSLLSGALVNWILEKMPDDRRPAYLAWYNLALNAALLIGSLAGPSVAGFIKVPVALLIFAVFRFLAAIAIWWLG